MLENIKVFAKTIEDEALVQIKELSECDAYKDCDIRIMPDCHAGTGCTIGTVIKIKDRIIPNTIGVDIGCGMLVVELGNVDIDFAKVDEFIKENIPSGFNVNESANQTPKLIQAIGHIRAKGIVDYDYAARSLGTLGGGNHFIEIDVDDEGNKYLVIHSGSRNLGVKICKYYQEAAYQYCLNKSKGQSRSSIIKKLKEEGREKEIESVLKNLSKCSVPRKDLCYIEGDLFQDYMNDMRHAISYAGLNRRTIARKMLANLFGSRLSDYHYFNTLHNYIGCDNILRKGAISARPYEKVIIPMNMRDGSLICVGNGNEDWLKSAPHGAGRLMSRTRAKMDLSMEEYLKEMNGIYTSSVCTETIDESPMAYKPMDEIIELINPTVRLVKVIKPIYNFKAKD